MKRTKKVNQSVALLMIGAMLILIPSCKKNIPDQAVFSPWEEKSSGVAAPQRFIIEMSEPDQTTCYGVVYDNTGNLINFHDITVTHDGGATWKVHTIAGLEDNIIYGVAATEPNTAHVFGWNYQAGVGGGNVFRTSDGGITWQREAANAYTDPTSFPDDIKFFNRQDGVMFGDPLNGYYEIYTTRNGGDLWERVPSKRIPPPLQNEYGVPFHSDIHENTIWMITSTNNTGSNPESARLLQSDDKGSNWYVKNSYLTFSGYDGSIKFRNRSVGLYKNNGILYRTRDGGATWKVVNYSGKWFSYDLDNIPGKPGWWISTGGGNPPETSTENGSSISYDDGDHWITLDNKDHTCVDMTSPVHGYSGGFTTANGNDGVFIYRFPPPHQP